MSNDKSSWAIGGGIIAGVGAGLFFMPGNPIAFAGSLLIGLGLGLILEALVAAIRK